MNKILRLRRLERLTNRKRNELNIIYQDIINKKRNELNELRSEIDSLSKELNILDLEHQFSKVNTVYVKKRINRSYPVELKQRVFNMVNEGKPYSDISTIIGESNYTVRKIYCSAKDYLKRHKITNETDTPTMQT